MSAPDAPVAARLPLAQRRAALQAQAAAQRVKLSQQIEPWRIPLGIADQGLAAVRYLKQHPQWLVGGAVALAVLRPSGASRWLQRAFAAWQMFLRFRIG